jgi:hypothetical protein
MRFLVEVQIPTEVGNAALKDGSLIKEHADYLKQVKPEAVYYTLANGKRTIYLVVNVESAERLPEITEPLWQDLSAEVQVAPVMTSEDFEKAVAGIEKILEARK